MKMEAATIHDLPDELLWMILAYIGPLELVLVTARVCRRWRELAAARVARVQRAAHYARLRPGLRALLVTDAERCVGGAGALIYRAIRMTPRLRDLTINCVFPLDRNDFKALTELVHLRHLDVFCKRQVLSRETIITPTVTSLVANETMSTGFFASLNDHKLRAFHMYGRAEYFMPREMEAFITIQSAYLTDLTLRCSEMSNAKFKVLGLCVHLVSLQLYICSMLTKRGIMSIVNLPALRRLHITGTTLLRNKGLLELIEHLPLLVHDLNLSGSQFGDEHCAALAARLPRLRRLELWRTPLRRDPASSLVRRLQHLEELDTDVEFEAAQIEAFERHAALERLRCRWLGTVSTRLALTSALQPVASRFLRRGAEGPSSELFYSWTRDAPPRLLQRREPARD